MRLCGHALLSNLWWWLQVPPGTQVPVMFDISHLPQVWTLIIVGFLELHGHIAFRSDDTIPTLSADPEPETHDLP